MVVGRTDREPLKGCRATPASGCRGLFRRLRDRFAGLEAASGRHTMLKCRPEFPIKVFRRRRGADNERPDRVGGKVEGSMGTVLEDVTSETIDAEHISRRVDDWEERLVGLFAAIGGWLPDGWEARPGAPVVMHEELMRKFGVSAKRMPTLELKDRAGHVARLVPRGLWIIGSNGRVDLKRDGRHYLIVDMAESFEAPDWQAAPAEERCTRESVSEDWLRRILR